MGFFKPAAQNGNPPTQKQLLEAKYSSARGNLLLVLAFTAINIILLLINADSYFLFSAAIPYFLVTVGMVASGKMPDVDIVVETSVGNSVLVLTVVIAVIILGLYLLTWFMSKKHVGWLIFALVLFAMDTLGMFVLFGFAADSIIDYLFHIWVLYYLIAGINAYNKLKTLPEEDPVVVIPMSDVTPVNEDEAVAQENAEPAPEAETDPAEENGSAE